MNAWILTGAGLNLSAAVMILAWIAARRLNNAGILEVARPVILILLALAYALLGEGIFERRVLLAILVLIASAKDVLAAIRIIKGLHPRELASYHILREKFPKRPWLMFFGYFQIQGVLTGLLAIPLAMVCANAQENISYWEIAGLILWVAAFLGGFRKTITPPSPVGVAENSSISVAEERLSFPWLAWISYCLMAVAAPGGIWGIISLLLICFLLR